MENGNFIEFVDEIYRRDELPVWRNVAQLVAAMAAFHHLHNSLKVSLKLYMYDVLIFIYSSADYSQMFVPNKSFLKRHFVCQVFLLSIDPRLFFRFKNSFFFSSFIPVADFTGGILNTKLLNEQIDTRDGLLSYLCSSSTGGCRRVKVGELPFYTPAPRAEANNANVALLG